MGLIVNPQMVKKLTATVKNALFLLPTVKLLQIIVNRQK